MRRKPGRPKHSTRARLAMTPQLHYELLEYIKLRQNIPSDHVYETLIRAYTILFFTGVRCSELCLLDSQMLWNVMYHGGKCSLSNETKTGRVRLLMFSKTGIQKMRELFENEWMEDTAKKKEKIFKIKPASLTKLCNKHMKLCLENGELYSTHSYRAGLITSLLESDAKVPVSTVSQIIGHRNIQTTLLYHSVSQESMENVLERVR